MIDTIRSVRVWLCALAAMVSPALAHDGHAHLPPGFMHLADIAPSIRQEMRYAGSDNVLGRSMEGYRAPACILTRQAADALSKVQADLATQGLTLVVFDCFRPIRAVDDLVSWTKAGGPPDPKWHPKVKRGDLIAKGYVGLKSTHSRGSTVDVSIARVDPANDTASPTDSGSPACGVAAPAMLDFGTGFDCFDPASKTASPAVSAEAARNRKLLVDTMSRHGFSNYPGEWWHFTLKGEPFRERRFDFEVE